MNSWPLGFFWAKNKIKKYLGYIWVLWCFTILFVAYPRYKCVPILLKIKHLALTISFEYNFRHLKYFLQPAAKIAVNVLLQIRFLKRQLLLIYDWWLTYLMYINSTKLLLQQGLSLANHLNSLSLMPVILLLTIHLIALPNSSCSKNCV